MTAANAKQVTRPAAVLWDMDGTLVDTEPFWIAAEFEIVDRYGNGRWTDEHAHNLVGFDLRDTARYMRKHGEVDMDVDQLVNELMYRVIDKIENNPKVPWRPGARQLLKELREARIPCALVTMSWTPLAMAIVKRLPKGTFAEVITGDDVTAGKPDPEPYEEAARRLGVDPGDCIAIEDSPTGVRSAVTAGCQTIAVPNVVDLPRSKEYDLVSSLAAVDVPYLRSRFEQRRRRGGLSATTWAIAAILLVGVVIGAWIVRGDDKPKPPDPTTPLHAWVPYWALERGTPSLIANAASFSQVSPFWFEINEISGPNAVATNQYARPEVTQPFLDAARSAGIPLVPAILDQLPASKMAAVLADPARRTAHIDALITFAEAQNAAGLDIDYEQFAFADGRASWEATRPNWVAFIKELGGRLHAAGRTLSVSIPPIYDNERTGESGYWVYDPAAIEPFVDEIRVMAYDYSTSEFGSVAPLDFVERAIKGVAGAVKNDRKIVLGVPTYGRNWGSVTSGICPQDAPLNTNVTQANIDGLLATRQATPVYSPITGETTFEYDATFTGETTCVQHRRVSYVPPEGTLARMDLARTHHLGGVSLWALGFDSPATWQAITPTITPRP